MPQGNKNIDSITLEELFSSSTDGSIPILLDIVHDEITWTDAKDDSGKYNDLSQEEGHLRLINSTTPVRYNGNKFLPSVFSYTAPSTDGKTVSGTTITISAIDKRIVEVIRLIKSKPTCTIEAFFTKLSDKEFMFHKLNHYEFEMASVTWDETTAKWSLVFDPASQINVPIDLGTKFRTPNADQEE